MLLHKPNAKATASLAYGNITCFVLAGGFVTENNEIAQTSNPAWVAMQLKPERLYRN